MKKFVAAGAVALMAGLCAPAFAQSGAVTIPGVGKASGSTGSEITNSRITVSGNKARDVLAGGGEAGVMKVGANVSMTGMANVNSVNITGSKVRNSEITVSGNEADTIKAIGGTANVNSVNIN
ncbi:MULTISPECIES: hypothetical protein [Pseudacidovorax]|uniref:Uncharacterized protein n=1 Tax=Pseudacidovorax intermedius TaxID=433924 RepID=A0A370FPD5_9BURK|nr:MULTISPECIES: hypothetical protein [Pseudacidovorax]MBO9641995.1 hypothetical protein [Pseudacidovorax sp.]MBP6898048.1 hypothetical protein [Pseudacidovorax sp.]RDI28711.1 hypothetical protein DFR41_101467 [Pseudacidovorax intermedius]